MLLNTLIIDTSTDKSLVVFCRGVELRLKILLPPGGQSSRLLMQKIDWGFKQLGWTPSSLEAIAVAIGPGSYTGIRVGAAAAKGLAFPRSLPLVGFCSLEGFVLPDDGRFASLIDARLGGAYTLLQERKEGKITLLSSPRLIPKEELASFLDGWPLQAGPHIDYPDPDHLALLATQKLAHPTKDIELLYLRTPDYRQVAI